MKIFDEITGDLRTFIEAQKLFFVATAPMKEDGHVNVSPKGYDTFKIIDAHTVAYLDLGGSGIETLAHLKDNGRITIMFMAMEGKAKILRLYGEGTAVSFNQPEFAELFAMFDGYDRARSVIKVNVTRIADSCGWAVPFYEFKGERDQLLRSNDNRTMDAWEEHRFNTNGESIDGLEGLVRE